MTGVRFAILVLYLLVNVLTARVFSRKEMVDKFVVGQNIIGLICTNLFYAPAWLLKGVRIVVLSTIK